MRPGDTTRRVIADDDALRAFCDALRGAQSVGLDTEFIRERTYVPVLETVQVAAPGRCALIDRRGVGDLAPLAQVLLNPRIEKVLHAAEQDLELLKPAVGGVPAPIFDTQIAAAMLGYGPQLSLNDLLERALGESKRHSESRADWSHRPLPAKLIEYALDDVCSLLAVHDHLRERLVAIGRLEWAREEFHDLEAAAAKPPPDDRRLYTRVRGYSALSRRGLAILRELASWREAEARRLNQPRGRILRDEALVALARRAPTDPNDLGAARWTPARALQVHAQEIVAAVRRGLAADKQDLPLKPRPARAAGDGVIELMQAVARKRAEEHQIGVHLLAAREDLARLLGHARGEPQPDLPLLHGWRWDLLGRDLVGLLEGRLSVAVDPATGDLTVRSS